MDESTQVNAPSAIQTSSMEWWQAPVQFAAHVLVGTFLFTLVALAAFLLEVIIRRLGALGLNGVMVVGLQVVEYTIFATDLLLFLIFIYRTTRRAVKEL